MRLHYWHEALAEWKSAGSIHGRTIKTAQDGAEAFGLLNAEPYGSLGTQWHGYRMGLHFTVTEGI